MRLNVKHTLFIGHKSRRVETEAAVECFSYSAIQFSKVLNKSGGLRLEHAVAHCIIGRRVFKDIIAIFRSSHFFFLVATLEIRRFVTEDNVFCKWNALWIFLALWKNCCRAPTGKKIIAIVIVIVIA